jgi:uncharacterized membrane protein
VLDFHAQQWLDLAVRWIHVIAGIAWIGTSFYFNWLNNHVRPPRHAEPGVEGELWSVHGGGFYRVVKYEVAPGELPSTLHWFKWEAYATWVSGFALMFIVYYTGPLGISVDPSRADLSRGTLVLIGVASMVAGWFAYDALCRTRLRDHPGWFAAVGLVGVAAAAWGYSQVMTGRAAYIHTGALIGTVMAANVFRVIIPSQRLMVDAMGRGEAPDPEPGLEAARRSLHNNYLTLPVVFIMVSHHFPTTYGSPWNWALLAAISVVGAGVRHWFNLRGQGRRNVWILPVAVVAMVALALATRPATGEDEITDVPETVVSIIDARCVTCHSQTPTQPGFATPPGGIVFDTPEDIVVIARLIGVVVDTGFMPLGNITAMTEEERAIVVAWARGE